MIEDDEIVDLGGIKLVQWIRLFRDMDPQEQAFVLSEIIIDSLANGGVMDGIDRDYYANERVASYILQECEKIMEVEE